MNEHWAPVGATLGAAVVALCGMAATRWAEGDLCGARRLAEAAWRLVDGGTFTDRGDPGEADRA